MIEASLKNRGFTPVRVFVGSNGHPTRCAFLRRACLVLFAFGRASAWECPVTELTTQQNQAQFQALDRKAQVEFRRGEFSQAAEIFRQATCAAPENVRSYYELYGVATAALAARNFAVARQALQYADQLKPNYALPLAMLIKVGLISGDIENVKTSLLAAAQRFPRDSRLHADLAQDLTHEKQNDLALAEALRFDQSGLKDTQGTINLAVLENQAGAYDDAIRHATAIEEQTEIPDKVRASGAAVAGLSYERLGEFQQAIQHLTSAIWLAPDQENAYLAAARIYEKEQNYRAAVQILEQARKQIPGSPQILLALGSSLISAEQHRDAARLLTELIQSSPDQFEAYPKLAQAYRNMGEPALSTRTLRNLARRKPDYPMLHVAIAQSMLEEELVDYPGVLEELALAEQTSPTDYYISYFRGKAYLAMNKFMQAVAALRQAVELRPLEAGAHYQLGLAYRRAGQPALAKEQFETVEYLKSQPATIKARD
ncbi:MAG: hypothetical protein DMG57_14075 [Acidobacteria bacterium]|nr:MAG: hypothetical protein DMG57_14075 [Acidobacteriota bacterium]